MFSTKLISKTLIKNPNLSEAFNAHAGDERIPAKVKEMEEELGAGNKKPEVLAKLAQYELTLLDWIEAHKGVI